MIIAVMSDSHDSLEKLQKAVEIINIQKPDLIIHAGDFCSPYTAFPFKDIEIPLVGVFGNNDGDKINLREKFNNIGEIFDYATTIEIGEGSKILLTHYPDLVDSLAKSGDYDFVIYGHTHELDIRKVKGTQIINPGALSGHISNSPTFLIVDTVSTDKEVFSI